MPVKRRQIVGQGRTRAAQAPRQSRQAAHPPLDPQRLARQVYLTVREFAVYGNFQSENAARLFLSRQRRDVPTLHRGRTALVARLDYDRYLEASAEVRHAD